MRHEFICSQCNEQKVHESDISTGYATNKEGAKICFACCGKNDLMALKELQPKQKICLYWDGKNISNWPGTLKIEARLTSKGRHNIAGTRQDVWFYVEGKHFHGIQYGSNTQIIHIKTSNNLSY